MPILLTSIRLINALNEWIGKTVSWLTLLMVITTFTVAVLRYVFDLGWIALQESTTYMSAMVFMLGAAYTLKHDKQVRVDIFYRGCSSTTKAWIDCLGTLFLLMPVAGFIIWSSWEYILDSWATQEGSRNSGGLPGVYLLKTTIALMAGLLLLQSIAMFLHNLLTVLKLNTGPQPNG